MTRKRIILLAVIIVPLACGLIFWIQRPAPEGLFLCPDALNTPCVLIARNRLGEPRIMKPSDSPWLIERTSGACAIFAQMNAASLSSRNARLLRNPGPGEKVWVKVFEIEPSATVPGDWDVVAITAPDRGYEAVRLKRPLPSLLHRVDDPRVIELVERTAQVRDQEWQTGQDEFGTVSLRHHPPLGPHDDLLQLGAALAAAHPDDPIIEMLYVDALIAARAFKTLESEVAKWRTRMQGPSFLRVPFRRAEQALRSWQLSEAGTNACDLLTELTGVDLQKQLRRLPELLKCEGYAQPLGSVWITEFNRGIPNFLGHQTLAKVATVMAMFQMISGRRDEALSVLAGVHRMGQTMSDGGSLIESLIGIAIRAIACSRMELYALNACESRQEIEALWQILEELNRREPESLNPRDSAQAMRLMRFESIANFQPEYSINMIPGIPTPNLLETPTRFFVAGARFQLVRMGAAARGRQIMHGTLPGNASEFGPLLPAGPPPDPFTSAPLRMAVLPAGIVCYSVGPDLMDNLVKITYDPSNGTTSGGDITMEVPAQRKYPFPRGGVRARTKNDLLLQFPNGLPADPFADTRGRPLNVTDGPPVTVYSFGPDGDEMDRQTPRPQAMYDPTNGTSSSGDLVLQITSP